MPDLLPVLVSCMHQSGASSIFKTKLKAMSEPLGYSLGKARHSGFQSVIKETAVRSTS